MAFEEISIVVPTYNSEKHISLFLDKLIQFKDAHPCIKEIIVINDGSNEETQRILNDYKDSISMAQYHPNYGQHYATLVGVKKAKFNYVLTCDDDVVFEAIDFDKLFEKIESADLIYLVNKKMIASKWRFLMIRFLFRLIMPKTKPPLYGSSQRFFKRSLLLNVEPETTNSKYFEALLLSKMLSFDYLETGFFKMKSHHRYNFLSRSVLILRSISQYNRKLVFFFILIIFLMVLIFINIYL